ncbi:hypothetical protein [Arthrobacter sp. CAN_A6]|uniref:hypothetical protein n=1 Tax=Arthrobacter sp. CAN_A6 TaxID=2787721 RepID=UPI0018CA92DB
MGWCPAQQSRSAEPVPQKRWYGGQLELEALQAAVRGKEGLWTSLLALSRSDERLDPEHPVVIGGRRFFPTDVRLRLDLVEQHRFHDGVMFLRYTTH